MRRNLVVSPSVAWTIIVIFAVTGVRIGTRAYDVLLPRDDLSSSGHHPDSRLEFALLPAGAWAYVIQQVWCEEESVDGGQRRNCRDNNIFNEHTSASTWRGVVAWEKEGESLRVNAAAVVRLLSDLTGAAAKLTVIIEAKKDGLVTLVPVTFQRDTSGMRQKTTGTVRVTGVSDYPHIIQSYWTKERCHNPGKADGLLVENMVPQFVRDRINHVELTDPDLLVQKTWDRGTTVLPRRSICDKLAQPGYHSAVINYSMPESGSIATQQMDLIFAAADKDSSHQPKHQRSGIKHRQRRRRKTRSSPSAIAFPAGVYNVQIMEEQLPPVEVIRLNLTNPDLPVKFSMGALMDSRSQMFFNIDSNTGVIRAESQLDREAIAQHHFRVTAVSKTDRSLTATTTVNIQITDRNDNLPTFEKSDYDVIVPESAMVGSVVVTVYASDLDAGANGRVTYSLVNPRGKNDAFQIDASNGVITTREPLDRELTEEHVLYVKAEDEGHDGERKSSIAKVRVRILDENDNTPSLRNSTCSLELREDVDWTSLPVVAQLHATDNDQGLNGQIRYSIISGNPNGQFILDAVTGDLKVGAPLDYESQRTYRLVIRIQDLGSPPRSNTTYCDIKIVDCNDHAPLFSTHLYVMAVAEDAAVGYPVVQTRAYDNDEGLQGKIIYSIRNQSTSIDTIPFVIDSDSGWITTSMKLDREKKDKYEFVVEATDLGTPPRTSTAAVLITLLDLNDNDPVFENHFYNVSISEGALQGSQIATVRATDKDQNARLTYQIASGNEDARFSMINQNGVGLILLTNNINYRQSQKIELTVEVADEAGKSDRAKVTVHVLAANLHRPNFLNAPFRVQIPENVPLGQVVMQLQALDEDVGENGRITYSMAADHILTDSFHLDPDTGIITTKKALNREAHAVFTIPVIAADHGAPSLVDATDVLIELIDVNDVFPQFTQSKYHVSVKEDVAPQTNILQVSAVDLDFGLNGVVRYAFAENTSSEFSIDSTLGIIRTNRHLDRETQSSYELVVLGIDRGEPALTSTVTVAVKVLDVNDNAPRFSPDDSVPLTFYVPENVTIGSSVAELSATDADEDNTIEYAIIGGPDAESFALVTRPNRPPLLSNLVELDHDGESSKRLYQLVIRASSPPLHTDVTVNIVVTDINDNAPQLKDFRIVLNNYPRNFPHGIIGRVPVNDLDATAKLHYRVTSGNKHSLLKVNSSTGDIQLSASLNSDLAYSAKFSIEVSDGVHTVSATCTLVTVAVDEEMLANSVTVRVANLTASEFLSGDVFDRVTAGLAFASFSSPETLDIFSLVEDSSTAFPILNITFAARDATGSRAYLKPDVLKERLFTKRAHFRNMTFVEMLPFDDSLCVGEPCPNFETCVTVQKFGQAGPFLSTDAFFFRSIQPVTTFQCKCQIGYTGMSVHYSCDTEVNLCYSSPCQNNGTCTSIEGGYQCTCLDGFKGDHCEINLALSGCLDEVCQKPGVCSLTSSQLVQCTGCASDDFHTAFCELTTRSFGEIEPDSYVVFPGIRARNRLSISLSFASNHKNGLLLYNGRHSDQADFIELAIVNGSIRFAFSLGRQKRTAVVPLMVADGEWHSVHVEYYNKTATVTVDECDPVLSLEHGADLDYRCAARISEDVDPHCSNNGIYECPRFLDLTGPLYLGGLPHDSSTRPSPLGFRGCLKDVRINQKQLNMNFFLDEHATSAGCPQKENFCADYPCQNGGTCVNEWKGHFCRCPQSSDLEDCSTGNAEVFQLDGDGYMLLQARADTLDVAFEFRTNKQSGTLINVKLSNKLVVTVVIRRQYVLTKVGATHSQEGEVRVTDEKWHTLHLTVHDGLLAVFVDDKPELQTTVPIVESRESVNVVMGGHETLLGHPHGFTGCIRNIQTAKRSSSPSFRSNVRDGCSSLVSSCESTACAGEFSECVEEKFGASCECQKGFIGKDCKDVCSFDPCKNGICVHADEVDSGYECKCFANYTGRYCEHAAPLSCPVTWWGYPVCGPCKCDLSRGFYPRCDRGTGECSCKENFYKPVGSDRCLECGCYFKGSVNAGCDEDGKCNCKSGVTGIHCDACLSPFAEVTEHGCEVVHGTCPRSFAEGIWWERTGYGMTASHNCPRTSFGKSIRYCDPSSKTWQKPDLSNCTSMAFDSCLDMLNEIRSGAMLLDTYSVIRVVTELQKALNFTMDKHILFAHDLIIAGDLLATVFKYESLQTGMNLTHRLGKDFLPELLDAVSNALDPSHSTLWKQIALSNRPHQTPDALTQLYHSYLRTILTHFSDTYMSPFEVITRNFKSGIQCLSASSDVAFPEIHPRLRGFTKVLLPAGNGDPTEKCQLVFYTEYADLPSIIQTTNNSSQKVVALTRAFYYGQSSDDAESDSPVYQFMKVRPRVSGSPQCMTFRFATSTWVADGCTATTENATHYNCSCSKDQLVAVIGDAHLFTNVFRAGFSVILFSTITMVLAVLINLAAFVLLLATRSTSGLVGVYQNVIFVALFGDVCFVLASALAWDPLVCKLFTAVLHFAFLANAIWCVLHAVQIYRLRKGHHGPRTSKAQLLIGYAAPMICVAVLAGIFPASYGAEQVCWMVLDDLTMYALVSPVIVLLTVSLVVAALAPCARPNQEKPGAGYQKSMSSRSLNICLASTLLAGLVVTLAVLTVSIQSALLGFVFSAVVLAQSIFFLTFMCLGTSEVASLIDEKLVWIVRRKLTSMTASHSAHKLNNHNVRETFRNPGISISDSTTFHRAARPDRDLSGSFEPVSAFSTLTRNNHLQRGTLEGLGLRYPDSHKESDGTNEDTISVHSSNLKLPDPTLLTGVESDEDSDFTAFRGHFVPDYQRPFGGTTTFGGVNNGNSWNSLPHRRVLPNSPDNLVGKNDRITDRQSPKLLTFRPASKMSSHQGRSAYGTIGETCSRSGSSSTVGVLLPKLSVVKSSRMSSVTSTGGTAV